MRHALLCLLLATSAASAKAPPISLEAGDIVSVRIPPDKATPLTVDQNGDIQLDTYGKFAIAGMTLSQARKALRKHLSAYLRNTARVRLELVEAGRLVLVTGQVKSPGMIRVSRGADVWEAINKAGGPGAGADLTRVSLIRAGKKQLLNVNAYLAGSQRSALPALRSGDTLFVPTGGGKQAQSPGAQFLHNEAVKNKVFVLGAVVSPGMYDRPKILDAVGALALAGGPRDEADLANLRVITREGTTRIDATAWLSGRTTRRPTIPSVGGSIIYVPTRGKNAGLQLGEPVTIMGAVTQPGRMTVPTGTKLIDAVGLAGGPGQNGEIDDVRVVRRGDRFTLATSYDLDAFMDEGGFAAMVEVQAADVIFLDRETEIWAKLVQVISDVAVIAAAFTLFTAR